MEIKARKIVALILCICICITSFSAEAKTKKTTGKDGEYITWNYDKKTKKLTFSGKGSISDFILDGHGPEPEWYAWSEKAEHIMVEEGITVIGEDAFTDFVSVRDVQLPETLIKINRNAFDGNVKLKIIKLPEKLQIIGNSAFGGCEKLEINQIPESVNSIGECAFQGCMNIKKFIFPRKIKKIGDAVLCSNREIRNIKLPLNLKIISALAFHGCKNLKQLNIPKSVTIVNMSAFSGSGLKKIDLPKNVESIRNGDEGQRVFECVYPGVDFPTKNLRVIEIHSKKLTKIEKNSFGGLSRKVVIKVPKSKKKKYTKMLRKSGLSKKIKIKSL